MVNKELDPVRFYRIARTSKQEGLESSEEQRTSQEIRREMLDTDMNDPEKLYRFSRTLSRSSEAYQVDSVVTEIKAQRSLEETLAFFESAPANVASSPATNEVVGNAAGEGNHLRSLFTLPGKVLDTVSHSLRSLGDFKIALPAAAMAVMAIVVVPKFMDDPGSIGNAATTLASVTEIPESLLLGADEIASEISLPSTASLGLSSGDSRRTKYFELGTIVTNVTVSAATEKAHSKDELLLLLNQFASSEPEGVVKSSVGELAAQFSASPHDSENIAKRLVDLNTAIGQADKADEYQQWHKLGQSIEAVQIANGVALNQDDYRPIRDTLSSLQSNQALEPTDPQTTKLANLLGELQQQAAGNENSPSRSDLRTIERLLSQIRVVVK